MDFQDQEQNRGRGAVMLTPTKSFLLLGVVTSAPLLAKIDQEMRPCMRVRADRQTHAQRQNEFIICPMLYTIAMGQIKMTI